MFWRTRSLVERFYSFCVPSPFRNLLDIRSISILYPFYTCSIRVLVPVLYPFCTHSRSCSLLGFSWAVLYILELHVSLWGPWRMGLVPQSWLPFKFPSIVNHVKAMKWFWKCHYSDWHLIHKSLVNFISSFFLIIHTLFCEMEKPFQTLCCCSGQLVGFKWSWPRELGSKFYQNTHF